MRATTYAVAACVVAAVLLDLPAAVVALARARTVLLAAALWAEMPLRGRELLSAGRTLKTKIDKVNKQSDRQQCSRRYGNPETDAFRDRQVHRCEHS